MVSADRRFLEYAQTGDTAIIQSLVLEFADRSYCQARRIIGRDDGVDDALQDAYLLLVSTSKRYDGSVPFAAWLGRLVTSAAINYRQQLKRRFRWNEAIEHAVAAIDDPGKQKSAEPPELDVLRAAIDSLPERYRMPLTLYYFGGLNQIETAQALGASSGTIASQLARGLDQLRRKLARAGFVATNAGVLAALASLPSYAASAELKASLLATVTSSDHVLMAANQVSSMVRAKRAELVKGSGLIPIGAATAVVAAAAVIFLFQMRSPVIPAPHLAYIAAVPTHPGLVAHWTFDEGQGETALDASGNGNDAFLENDPVWIAGRIGGALLFDGIDDFVNAPSSSSLNSIKSQMTVAAWVFNKSHSSDNVVIVGRRHGPDHWDLWDLNYGVDTPMNSYSFDLQTDHRCEIKGPSSAGDLNKWVHLAGVFDGSEVRLYRNGLLAASSPCSGVIPDETAPVTIGAGDNGEGLGIMEHIDAIIDDIRIYNRALSGAEISALAR